MATQPTREAERAGGAPVGTLNVVDPHPLNWLYITWNTMEEPVRTDERGHIVGAVMEESRWTDEKTIKIKVRQGIRFQDGEECTAHSVKRRMSAPYSGYGTPPPGLKAPRSASKGRTTPTNGAPGALRS